MNPKEPTTEEIIHRLENLADMMLRTKMGGADTVLSGAQALETLSRKQKESAIAFRKLQIRLPNEKARADRNEAALREAEKTIVEKITDAEWTRWGEALVATITEALNGTEGEIK